MTETKSLVQAIDAAAIAAEVAEAALVKLAPERRVVLFAAVLEDGEIHSTLRTQDFPLGQLGKAVRMMRNNARDLTSKENHASIKSIDAALVEDEANATSMGN